MNSWSNETPKTTGYYWFYGDPFSDRIENNDYIEVYFVKVQGRKDKRLVFICEGNFMENKKGMWMEAEVPFKPQ